MHYVISENKLLFQLQNQTAWSGLAFTQMPRFNSETVSTRKECAIVLSEWPGASVIFITPNYFMKPLSNLLEIHDGNNDGVFSSSPCNLYET